VRGSLASFTPPIVSRTVHVQWVCYPQKKVMKPKAVSKPWPKMDRKAMSAVRSSAEADRQDKEYRYLDCRRLEKCEAGKQGAANFGGFSERDVSPDLFLAMGSMVGFGRKPALIGLATDINGIYFNQCYGRRIMARIDGIHVPVISLGDLKLNNRASSALRTLPIWRTFRKCRELQKKYYENGRSAASAKGQKHLDDCETKAGLKV
jgi:hypothetical protein